MDDQYEKDLRNQLADANKRAAQAIAAKDFLKTDAGQLIQDWVNERISYEMEKMTGKTALDTEDYLERHGAVRLLKEFNVMLNSKASQVASTQQEVQVLNEQSAAVNGQEPIKF